MFYSFPEEQELWTSHEQYMVGPSLLVKPIVTPETTTTTIHLPGPHPWYDYFSHKPYPAGKHEVDAPIHQIPVYIQGGSILPTRQRHRRTSTAMAKDPFTLLIAVDEESKSKGEVYMDDGETYKHEEGDFIRAGITLEPSRDDQSLLLLRSASLVPRDKQGSWVEKVKDILKIERIHIIGLSSPVKRAIIQGEVEKEAEVICDDFRCTLRAPWVSVAQDWTIKLEM